MRLLHVDTLKPRTFHTDFPPYAVVSHLWGYVEDEVTLNDLLAEKYQSRKNYGKLRLLADQAQRDGLQWMWMDTCCLDPASSIGVSESINSMFRWFAESTSCYVYLQDVSKADFGPDWRAQLRNSRWFTRGWTLQELIAPRNVVFLSSSFDILGTKDTLLGDISKTTGIPEDVLLGTRPISSVPVQEKLKWSEGRLTTRVEDRAYSLLGLFDVHMPLLYGEGEMAMDRLMAAINSKASIEPDYLRSPPIEDSSREPLAGYSSTPPRQSSLQDSEGDPWWKTPSQEILARPQAGQRPPAAPHDDSEYHRSGRVISPRPRTHTAAQTRPPARLYNDEIRLLTLEPGVLGQDISGHIQRHDLAESPTYYALSYVWGPEPSVHKIRLDDAPVFVQPNLFHALQRFRLPDGTYPLWVDKLCINQSDLAERSQQVSQMGRIYGKASGVLIWLGEEDRTSKLALDFMQRITSSSYQWTHAWWNQPGFAAIVELMDRPWFRRGWVIQEAAYAKSSILRCGDRELYFDSFVTATRTIRDRLQAVSVPLHCPLLQFDDAPAVKLVDTVTRALRRNGSDEEVENTMSLETLVYKSLHSETSECQDVIYSLLSLAKNETVVVLGTRVVSRPIRADYDIPTLDVFADFVMHSSHTSGHLDIICRPWAPSWSKVEVSLRRQGRSGLKCPSWICTRDRLPFGEPSLRSRRQLNGIPLANRSAIRCYNAHYGTKPEVSLGKDSAGYCDGSLRARGVILGTISRLSMAMADAAVTKECLQVLRPGDDADANHDIAWRTLCADRTEEGSRAPHAFDLVLRHLMSDGSYSSEDPLALLFTNFKGMEPDDLLARPSLLPEHAISFLQVVQSVVWKRRTFRTSASDKQGVLVGLAPQQARIDDLVCILHGCSVPVILRRCGSEESQHYELVGDAYVHAFMDGEAFFKHDGSSGRREECTFTIR